VSALAQPPAVTHIIAVQYPTLPRMARISGDVRLSLKVPTDGGSPEVSVISGHKLLASDTKSTLEKWRFAPCSSDSCELDFVVTFRFSQEKRCSDRPEPSTFEFDAPAKVTVTALEVCLQP
jgi:TonB family protein